jgi:hypothetical protein
MNHRQGHQQSGYKAVLKQKEHDHGLIERYLTVQALLASHEAAKDPDYIYIKQLEHRRDVLKKQIVYNGLL